MNYAFALIVALHARLEDRVENLKDRGATATEYAMLVAFIAIVISFAVSALLLALAYRSFLLTADDEVEDDVEDRRIAREGAYDPELEVTDP